MRDYLNSGDLFRVARPSNQQTISCLLLGKKPKTLSKALKLFRSFEGPFHISKNKKSKSLWKIKKKKKKKGFCFVNHYKCPQKRRGKKQQQRIKKKDQGRYGYFKSWVISNLCIFPFNIPPDPNAHREQAVHCDQHIRPIVFPSPRRLHAASPLNELIGEQWIPEACSAHPGSRDASDLHTRQKLDHASKKKQKTKTTKPNKAMSCMK